MEFSNLNIRAGFLGGTLFSIVLNISSDDLLFTVVRASIGASVRYVVSTLLNFILSYFRKQ